jgi:Lrp/AsnC family leucine-responsive transcriptional regulator
MPPEKLIDEIDLQILAALQENARISFAQLARNVGLSGPAVTERVKRLEEEGVITGYHANVNLGKIGYHVSAFVRIQAPREHFAKIISLARSLRGVRECVHVDGDEAFYLRVAATSAADLEEIVNQFRAFGATQVAVILSSPVQKYTT